MIGSTVGNYRIVAHVADGGMGSVFRGEHNLIGRSAAIKVLHPEFSHNRAIVERFFNEARATSAIKHPGIVEVLDFGYLPSGHAYLVMEFLEGEPLSHRLASRGRMPEAVAALLIRQLCSSLAAAHKLGIVHRDLKPDNVYIIHDAEQPGGERPKLLDFGIAKLSGSGVATSKTRTGAVMGTPTYMSPEQCKGVGDVDARADLYSLGCILYELVTGRPPFVSEGAGELIGAHLFTEPESPARHAPHLSPAMTSLIMRLLAKKPEDRPQTAVELAAQLAHLAGMPTPWSQLTPAPTTGVGMGPGYGMPQPLPTPLPMPLAPRVSSPQMGSSPGVAADAATMFNPDGLGVRMPTPPPRVATVALTNPNQTLPPKPTTLSGAAAQAHQAHTMAGPASSPRRWPVIAAVAVVGATLGVVLMVVTAGGGAKQAGRGGEAIEAGTVPIDAAPPLPPVVDAAAPAVVDAAPAAVTPDAAPQVMPDAAPTAVKADPIGDKQAADKQAADKQAADKQAADKQAADKKAADKKAADKKAADKRRTNKGPDDSIGPIADEI